MGKGTPEVEEGDGRMERGDDPIIHKISLMWETEPHCIFEKIIEQGLPYTVDPQKPHRDYRRMFKMST